MTDPRAELDLTRKLVRAGLRQPWSLEAFCGGHTPQLAFCQDRSQWIHAMCARQSGKTQGDDGILFDNADEWPRSTNLFLGLKGTGVNISNWFPIWKPLCERFGLPPDCHNEVTMRTTFPNRARVMFAGTDDLSNVKKYLGNRLDHGVVIIDEAQDQPDAVLRYILKVLLPPMMTPTTRVILSGVLPDVPAGMFYELAADRELSDAPELRISKGFSHHEWGRAANVHTPEAMGQLKAYMRDRGLTIEDPQIQRDWYMRRVWDVTATVYRYDRARNGYQGAPPADLDTYSVAIDPGSLDRTAVILLGWSSADPRKVWHVDEWVTERGARASWAEIADACRPWGDTGLAARYWYYDAGSSQNTLDTFQADYGIPAVHAAKKSDFRGQVDRMNDLLLQGRLMVRIGSKLEEDLQRAKFDSDARGKGRLVWANAWHPDPSEACRYALAGYFNDYQAPEEPKPVQQQLREKWQARQNQPQRDKDAEKLRMGAPTIEDEEDDEVWGELG